MTAHRRDAYSAVLQIVKKLRAEGHVALLVGGCVRDRLLGRTPKDYDVATDATPARLKEVFPRAREVGAQFGVMLVRRLGHDIEVATFRADGPYSDGRHPDQVTFGTDVEDARRRDFTINGLFLDPIADRIIDHVEGRADLKAGIVRTIGDPAQRFAEDHLRMLRAVRFAARLGFAIESSTREAIRRLAGHLEIISAERVWLELEAMLREPTRAAAWSLLVETGLAAHLVSGWATKPDEDALIHARLAALPAVPLEAALGLAAMLCARPPSEVAGLGSTLRLSNRLCKAVVWMVASLPSVRHEASLELAELKMLMAKESWPALLALLRADLVARGESPAPQERLERRAAAIAPDRVAPPPFLTGDDLRDMGMSPGPRMGDVLRAVYRAQLAEAITVQEEAIAMARDLGLGQE